MATVNTTFLDLTGLAAYDAKIKQWANSVNQVAFKTAHKSSDGNNLYLYKKANAVLGTDTPDATIALGSGALDAKLTALASAMGAVWDSTNEVFNITLDSTFDSSTVSTVVDALNALKGEINTLNGADTVNGSVAKKIKDAIDGLDVAEFPLTSISGSILTIGGIKEVDGKIAKGDNSVSLAKVAMTGAAADVSYDKTGTNLQAATVQAALTELDGNIASLTTDAEITLEEASTPTTGFLKTYNFYQGDTSDASKKAAAFKGKIDIPKDFLVKSGSIVDDPAGQPAGKYLALVINSKEGDDTDNTVYINIADLVDAYTAAPNAAEIQVAISNANVVSASVVDVAASKVTYIAADAGAGTSRESVGQALTRLDGDASTTGSVAKKVQDAINALDTSSDVAIASYDSTTSTITLANGVKEENGMIAQGTGDGITIAPIGSTAIDNLFA